MKIAVTPEGRPGLWLADRASLTAWLEAKGTATYAHLLTPAGPVLAGFDSTVGCAVEDVTKATRVAVATGDAFRENMGHALAVVLPVDGTLPERLHVYDVGELDPDRDLEVTETLAAVIPLNAAVATIEPEREVWDPAWHGWEGRVTYRVPALDDHADTDYEEGDDGRRMATLDEANCVSSIAIDQPGAGDYPWDDAAGRKDGEWHLPALDIDLPCQLRPSSTPGHFHLLIDHPVRWCDYVDLLHALAACGIVEPGYVSASIERGATFLRLPGVKKKPAAQPRQEPAS